MQTYQDNIAVVVRAILVGLLPLFVQVLNVLGTWHDGRIANHLALLTTIAGSIVGLIFLGTVIIQRITVLGTTRERMTVYAADSVVNAFHIMHTVESLFQVIGCLVAMCSNAYFIMVTRKLLS